MNYYRLCAKAAFLLALVAAPAVVFAGGKTEEANFTTPAQLYYLSPKIADGNTDTLEINLSETVTPGRGRTFVQSVFTVYDTTGSVVFEQVTPLEKAKTIPSISYDGTDKDGNPLTDGVYIFTIVTTDNKNNKSSSDPFPLVVDNTPPEIRTVRLIAGNVVVPSADDGVGIAINGTPELLWEAYAVSADGTKTLVLSQKSEQPQDPPQTWEWKGTASSGAEVASGAYELEVRAQDGAGNSATLALDTKLIVSSEGALTLSSDLAAVSPNGDGVMDRAALTISGDEALLESFESVQIVASVPQENGRTQKAAVVDAESVTNLYFEGEDQFGLALEEGPYEVFVQAKTKGGDVYVTNRVPVAVDATAPKISFSVQTAPTPTPADEPLYVGGEDRAQLVGTFSVDDPNAKTELRVLRGEEEVALRELPFSAQPAQFTIPADFQVAEGQEPVDGLYTAFITSTDEAGNTAKYPPVKVIRDTEEKTLTVTTSAESLSANKNPITISSEYSQTGLKETLLEITDADGKAVRTEALPYYLPSYEWNARDNANVIVPDGAYDVKVTAVYYNGAFAEQTLSGITVDSTPPEITEFTPNAEIIEPQKTDAPNAVFSVAQNSNEEGVTWKAEIRSVTDEVIFSQETTELSTFTWDVKTADGANAPDGDYFYVISAEDAAGNKAERTASFVVDTGVYNAGEVLNASDPLRPIYFSGYNGDLFAVSEEEKPALYENLLYIRGIARLLKTDSSYTITITGHAAGLLSGAAGEREQNEVLIPLSRERATSVSRALEVLGIDAGRITLKAVGGSFPAVENPSAQDIGKNRRVEFEIAGGVQSAAPATDAAAEQSADQPADQSTGQPADAAASETAQDATGQPATDQSAGQPADQTADQSAEQPADAAAPQDATGATAEDAAAPQDAAAAPASSAEGQATDQTQTAPPATEQPATQQ